jgi:glycine cleavage system H protein
MAYPTDRKYTKDHEWARKEGDLVVVGITDHAQNALGDVVFVEVPAAGRELKSHETFGVVESIKAVSDLYSPMAGQVVAANETVKADPALINREPHGGAWLIKLKPANAAEYDSLMDAAAYEAFVKTLA